MNDGLSNASNVQKIGVVTVTYNSAKFLDEFIHSVKTQDYKNFTTYIIDNASVDSTVNDLKKLQLNNSQYQLIVNSENIGVAAANNQGIKSALADGCHYVLLLNNDTTFPSNLFELLIHACIQNNTQLSAPKMYFANKPDTFWWGGGNFIKHKFFAGSHEFYEERDTGQADHQSSFEYCPTCCLLIKATVFETIGYMDEKYFVYYDDVDFGLRMHFAKIKSTFVKKAKLWHKVSGSTGGGESDFSVHYMNRNRTYYIKKNLGLIPVSLYLFLISFKYFGQYFFNKGRKISVINKMKSSYSGLNL
jgi:GT2 family glycosyltransferase